MSETRKPQTPSKPGKASADTPTLLMHPSRSITREELIALRRDLHRHPEVAFTETRTYVRTLYQNYYIYKSLWGTP